MTFIEYLQSHLRAFPASALPLLLITAAISVLLSAIAGELGVLGFLIVILMLVVYGDPARTIPDADGMIIAPADAQITSITPNVGIPLTFDKANDQAEHFTRLTLRQRFLGTRTLRAPLNGTIIEITKGASITTDTQGDSPLWSRYDEVSILLRDQDGLEYALVVRAPLIPNQIWLNIAPGATISRGDRLGLIAVIGMIDLYIPDQKILYKSNNQRTHAGETVIAVTSGSTPVFRTI